MSFLFFLHLSHSIALASSFFFLTFPSSLSLVFSLSSKMARKKIREHDSKRLLREHIKRLAGLDLPLKTVQVRRAERERD